MALAGNPVKIGAMLQALSAPMFKSIALAGLGLGLGIAAVASSPSHGSAGRVTYRLALHAVERPNEVYLTAFRNGDIRLTFDGGKIHAVTLKTYASVSDGCRWLGVERLTPIDHRSFRYDYSEQILDCDADAEPARKTPRQGIVTVED
jgi:hypothetical protein